jgi:hypothetical protein
MAVRVLPCANVVVVINDDKQLHLTEDGAVEHEAELQSRLLRLVSAMRTCLSSRAACDAFVGTCASLSVCFPIIIQLTFAPLCFYSLRGGLRARVCALDHPSLQIGAI